MNTPTAQLLARVATRGDTAVETATRALAIAATAHHGQLRKSRDPYITHPIAVATCVADLNTNVAALLHDVPFDTDYPFTAIRTEFGDRVCNLIEDLGRLDRGEIPLPQIDHVDPCALLIKIADRLHNMQTIQFVEKSTQQRKSDQTLQVIAPLARRLGLGKTAAELEDLANATLCQPAHGRIPGRCGR
jgi:GTP diphosphokinase / guanosine-3',5'-bis(diphosphate) 3'-diphosphatase